MRRIIILLLLLPFVSAQGLVEGNFLITYNDSGNVSRTSANMSVPFSFTVSCPELEAPAAEEDACADLVITGLPSAIMSGEQLSYSFFPWQDGDAVTYWIEDAHGEVIKKPYTTTSSGKKSYTPSFEEAERGIIIRAERTREGCDLSMASVAVIVLGEGAAEEPVVCEQPPVEECVCDNPVSSLYVRAQNWQENITLYGNVVENGTYWLFGEETPRVLPLGAGAFSIGISPAKGNNTYGLAPIDGVRIASFALAFDGPEPMVKDTTENLSGSYSFPATGAVVLEDGTERDMGVLLAVVGVIGGSLAF